MFWAEKTSECAMIRMLFLYKVSMLAKSEQQRKAAGLALSRSLRGNSFCTNVWVSIS